MKKGRKLRILSILESNLTDAVGSQSAYFIYTDLKTEFDYADFLKHREKGKSG